MRTHASTNASGTHAAGHRRGGIASGLERVAALAAVLVVLIASSTAVPLARAEVVEEIVAWVNGDIITKTEYEAEEQVVVAEAYRQLAGEELDRYLAEIRKGLLLQMIDRKILVDQAATLYDIEVMGDVFLDQFKEQQGITSEEEFRKLIEQEGMTVDEVRQRLVEMLAPEEVVRFRVSSRIAISDREIEEFYEQNRERFGSVPEATLSEIVLLAADERERESKRELAEAVRRRVTEGNEDFAEVAREVSEAGTREAGGKLGTMKREELADHLAAPAFTVPPGEVSDLIETRYGFHILRVDARSEATVRPLDEVEGEIRGLIRQLKYGDELSAYLDRVRGESDWCVKSKYQQKLAIPDAVVCEGL